jgi:hypothetical protein
VIRPSMDDREIRSALGATRPRFGRGDGFERCFWLHHCSATVTSRVDLNMETGEMTGSVKGTLSP